jgi:ergothioneine biosynthesis protein EgtB
MEATPLEARALEAGAGTRRYRAVREASRALCAPLSEADATVQSMPDASPAKWHLAHTSWFFETLVLAPYLRGYRPFDARFEFLFNSYYESVGARQPRPLRGLLTRPDLATVEAYRDYVDGHVAILLEGAKEQPILDLIELGCQHEQQHQELILTDILHLFAQNPLKPSYIERPPTAAAQGEAGPMAFVDFAGGIVKIGHCGDHFGFDCEKPRHRILIEPFRLADRAVTNGEWIEFIADGGYRNPLLWLSEGWALVGAENWTAPLYWQALDGEFVTMSLHGPQIVDPAAPVVHISYFEADAFARWAGRRLPSEAEWEVAAQTAPPDGNFISSGLLRPAPAPGSTSGLRQMFGDVWEWTRSAFAPYPRFQPLAGAAGEYNGKFMSGQFVLRGGSCATPAGHVRPSYRNFFPPQARWQFSGLRLAEDA